MTVNILASLNSACALYCQCSLHVSLISTLVSLLLNKVHTRLAIPKRSFRRRGFYHRSPVNARPSTVLYLIEGEF